MLDWWYHHVYAMYWWLVQYCSISIANAMEILQSCTKRYIYDKRSSKWLRDTGDADEVSRLDGLAQECGNPSMLAG